MFQILVFNAINTIVTDMECNIRIDRLPPAWAISFPLVCTTTLGQSEYPDIALHISNYNINHAREPCHPRIIHASNLGT